MARPLALVGFALVASLAAGPRSAHAQWDPGGLPFCTAAGDQQFPAMVPDAAGGAIVAWQDARSGNADIYARRLSGAGIAHWTPDGVALCTASGDQWEPRVATDGAGGAIVTWYDYRGGSTADVYAQRVDAVGVPQWTTHGVALSTASNDQVVPVIAADGAGGAIVAWNDYRNGFVDIYAQRIDASGVPQWTSGGVPVCTAANNQSSVAIVADGTGGAILAWQDGRGTNDDIYAQRLDAAGAPQWTAGGIAVCAAPGGQLSPVITTDGSNGAIVAWRDGRSGARGIYARRVSALGVPQWTVDGVALSTAGTFQLAAQIVADGAGGAIVTWQDNRAVTNYDVFARRVDASGAAQWSAGGVPICTAANDQSLPQIAPDGAGGAVVAWSDVRSGSLSEIYAQRVGAAGSVLWTADGLLLCAGGSDKIYPAPVPDGSGGTLFSWQDYRNGAADIYAQRLDASGAIPTAAPEIPAAGSAILARIHPNPTPGPATFEIRLPRGSAVRIDVFDVSGRLVRRMSFPDASLWRRVPFDGRDARGDLLPSGVYLYRVDASGDAVTRKLVITR